MDSLYLGCIEPFVGVGKRAGYVAFRLFFREEIKKMSFLDLRK